MKTLLGFVLSILCCSGYAQSIYQIQGQADASPLIGQSVSTTGIVTGVHASGYFIQEESLEWSGIYVYDTANTPVVGDEIELTATVEEYFGLTELKTVTSFEILSSGNALPEPLVITTAEVNSEAFESVLVSIENATCTNNNLGFGEYQINDGSGVCMGDDLLFIHSLENNQVYNLTGPLYYSFSNFKIVPRSAEDIEIAQALYFTSFPVESDLSSNSITIQWSTNVAADSYVEYGLTNNYELGEMYDANPVIDHAMEISNLEPGTIYYLRIHSEAGEETTSLVQLVVCTVSESSGNIEVYFNHSVDPLVATTEDAVWTLNITDTIIHYIHLAEERLDICMYDLLGAPQSIFDAINERHDAGVQVRYISDDEPLNVELDWLNPAIPVLKGNTEGIMHDKFLVIDADNAMNAWVLTGSFNQTAANLGWDYNNMICIQDQSLARSFLLEFNEMWGSTGAMYDESNARFGSAKTNNTPHHFLIDGIAVELYFSPTDGTTNQIVNAIGNAQTRMAFGVMVFTENNLGTAVQQAHADGVDVMGIIDYVEFNGSEFQFLLDAGIDVLDYQNEDGTQWPDGPTLHHKYAIIDYAMDDSNPVLITGSHNWTASANSINDENTLLIHDHTLANIYFQEFSARWQNMNDGNPDLISENKTQKLQLFPNPVERNFTVSASFSGTLSIFDTEGKLWKTQFLPNQSNQVDCSGLPSGIYVVKLVSGNSDQEASTMMIKR
jgi:phosphatidylserine/phosphatidylglycerophosphate/cardiolipin synthase-like enzyme